MARAINRFFSPRQQGQFTSQFVEEPFPFREAFMVGAGPQKKIEEALLQVQALQDVETRPIMGDIEGKNEIIGDLHEEINTILGRKGKNLGNAALDISKAIGRTKAKPFFAYNTAALAQAEQAEKVRTQIMGRGETPLGLDMSALETPLQDPETGEFNQIGFDIRQSPDLASIIDDQYADLTARKTESGPQETGVAGKIQTVTTTVLSPADIKIQAAAGTDTAIATAGGMLVVRASMIQNGLIAPDATDSDVRKAMAGLIEGQLADNVRDDLERQLISIKEEPTISNYDGWEIGNNISANVVRGNDASRGVTVISPGQTTEGEFGLVTEPDEQQQFNMTSENIFTIRQNTKAGGSYKLLISPQVMWDMEDFGDAITNLGEEDFELDEVRDFMVADADITIGEKEYKKGQPLMDEDVLGLDLATLKALPDAPSVTRKFFAVGRITIEETREEPGYEPTQESVERSVMVPYRSVKKTIKAQTSTDGKGGFEVNEKDFFQDKKLSPLERARASTDSELKAKGWSDEQISKLRAVQ